MGDLTENFSSSEFECQCAEDCVAKNPAMQMDADFMKKLQTLSSPIEIVQTHLYL